jgi:L-ascorbate metabolism protein UlaG (beta-lactamase superfamily)
MARAILRMRGSGWLAWLFAALLPASGWASCIPVAEQPARFIPAAYKAAQLASGSVKLTFVGHATFLIETSGGATAVTDFNGFVRPTLTPDIATMNNAHSTHFTDFPDPGIKFVLPGWGTAEKPVQYNFTHLDLHVYNVQTNVRDWSGGTRLNGNSIFVFETGGLCIAHLGHLHHSLTDAHLAMLGKVDVLLVPVDGALTMGQFDMIEVIQRIKAPLIIPMHFFSPARLARFVERLQAETRYVARTSDVPEVVVSAAMLPSPSAPQMLILPGY